MSPCRRSGASRSMSFLRRVSIALLVGGLLARPAEAQAVSERGFVEARGQFFPQDAANDPTQAVGDVLVREEVFAKLTRWLQFAVGVDLRASTHGQVDDDWGLNARNRGAKRPRFSLRRATATISRGRVTVDVGTQFIRWGKTDVLNPTDRFAARDFLNVFDADFLPVTGVRGALQLRQPDTIEVVFLPWFTPSRIPLL